MAQLKNRPGLINLIAKMMKSSPEYNMYYVIKEQVDD